VTADTEAPKVSLIRSTNIADIGNTVYFQVRATDNIGIQNLQLFINNQAVIIDGNGVASYKATQAGVITAKAVAIDLAGNRTETETTINVTDPTDVTAPQISLDLSGITEGTITAPTQILGTVSDTNLDYYILEIAPIDGTAGFKEIFRGTSIITNGILGTIDPSLLQNDTYILRLSAYDTNGQGTTIEDTLNITGDLKLGNFRLSFTDLVVPVTGIPITLTRTYDTLTSTTQDDFGYGWRMEFRDTDLRTSLGKDPLYEELGIRSVGFTDKTRVYITLPGGTRQSFTFQPVLNPEIAKLLRQGAPIPPALQFRNPAFVADKGITSTLSVRPSASSQLIQREDGTYINVAGQVYNPADSYFGGVYVLTTKEGIVYEIDGKTGDLLTVTDTNGNKLTYTDSAITSSTGQKVTFERDAQGRITTVIDPMGNKVTYSYDAQGDLIAVTDREGNTTRYEYDETQAHYLDEIIDPLGRTGVKNEYDDKGRLKQIEDANGNAVEMIYDPDNSIQRVKDALGNETVYEYDSRGNVVTEIDAEGKITKRTYDDSNNVLTETLITTESGSQGWTTTYTYDSRNNQLSRTNALGHTDYYTYDSRGNLLSTTDPLGNTTRYTYDRSDNLLSKSDASGYIIRYTYDQFGNRTSVVEGSNDVTRFVYDSFGRQTQEIDAMGNITAFEYDANGNIIKESKTLTTVTGTRTLTVTRTYTKDGEIKAVVDAEGGLTQYEYDANGNQTLIIDPLGRQTQMRYDSENQLLETIFPDSTPSDSSDNPRIKYRYDANGNRIGITDLDGDTTTYSYNSQKLPTGIVVPDATPSNLLDNPKISSTYTQAGSIKTLVRNGLHTEFEHDAVGRVILTRIIADGLSLETRTTYDATGRKLTETDPINRTTHYEYDAVGRLIQTTFADGSFSTTAYNNASKPITQTDAAGRTTHYEYDVLDRLIAVIDANNQRLTYSYDEMSNLISQTDATGHTTTYEYDGLGRRTAVVKPMGQRSETFYNAVGQVVKTRDFNGDEITYSYDSQDRLISKNLVQDGLTITFSYTVDGHKEAVTDGQGTTRYEYNVQGQLLSQTEPDNTEISYSYDPITQRVKTVTTPSGTTVYEYNSLEQLRQVTAPDGSITQYTYDTVGNLISTIRPNGTIQIYRYDALDRLTYLESKDHAGKVLASYTYTYDAVGNKLSVEELGGRKISFVYDKLNQIIKETTVDPEMGNHTLEYAYDSVGNRLSKTDSIYGTTVYRYDANDRLGSETTNGVTITYTYDDNGNLISEQSISKTVTYEWDNENHLVKTVTTDVTGIHQVQYRYNDDGIRVATIFDGQEVRYLVDSNRQYAQVVEEYSPTGVTVASYTYGNTLLSQIREGSKSFYHFDGHSGVRQLTNESGEVTDTYFYDSYGNILNKTGSTENSYLYRGEQSDPETSLQYLRARYYAPANGRLLSADPFEGWQEQSLSRHRYLYGNNNPVMYSDPSGMTAISAELGATNVLMGILASMRLPGAITAGAVLAGAFAAGVKHRLQSQGVRWEGQFYNATGLDDHWLLKTALLKTPDVPSAAYLIVRAPIQKIELNFQLEYAYIISDVEIFAKTAAQGAPASITDLAGEYAGLSFSFNIPNNPWTGHIETPIFNHFFMGWGKGAVTKETNLGISVGTKVGIELGFSVPLTLFLGNIPQLPG
jgi:large repetitive protein